MIGPALLKAIDLGFAVAQKFVDWNEARLAKQKAARAWAETPAPIRACFRCQEIAYLPGQVACNKCGALL